MLLTLLHGLLFQEDFLVENSKKDALKLHLVSSMTTQVTVLRWDSRHLR